jgi:hypothetical protein
MININRKNIKAKNCTCRFWDTVLFVYYFSYTRTLVNSDPDVMEIVYKGVVSPKL